VADAPARGNNKLPNGILLPRRGRPPVGCDESHAMAVRATVKVMRNFSKMIADNCTLENSLDRR
jgi:hypothetical protein